MRSLAMLLSTTRFFCKNIVYKNIEAEICPKIKNILRISPASIAHDENIINDEKKYILNHL